jgi:hypothetical protein
VSDHLGVPSLGKEQAKQNERLYELERKARLDEDADPHGGCCLTYCAFKSGTSTLGAGVTSSLTFNIKREQRGRVLVWGTACARIDTGTDLFFGGRISVGGTFYDPRITERKQGATAGDRVSVAPLVAVDFTMGTDMAVAFEVANHWGSSLTWLSGALIAHVFYTRAGSLSCSPPIGGTGV